jgi:iron(III) transport system substrate-binding protein
MSDGRLNRLAAAAAALLAVPGAALAQGAGGMKELARYQGPDRLQRLVDGARREGALSIYTSVPADDLRALVAGFEKKYGLKVSVWRSSSENVLQRVVTEARAGRFTVDVVETNGPELEALHREKVLQAIESPRHAHLLPAAIRPHGEWVGTRLNVFVQAYNTGLIKKDELPRTWEDLLHPRWKGRLGVEAEDQDWLAGVIGELGEVRGTRLFRDISAANGVSVRKGHTLLTHLVVSGEIPLALTVYNYKAEQLKRKGEPIDWFCIGRAIARPNGVAVARRAPNPHAAVLFYDYEIGEEEQQVLARSDFVPTNTRVDSPFAKMPLRVVDARMMLDEHDKWTMLYDEIFNGRRR